MNSPSDIGPSPVPGGAPPAKPVTPYPSNWKKALAALVSARLALIQIESKDAGRTLGKRLVCLVIAALCAFFTWVLVLAGGISLIVHATGWAWGWVTLAAAALHLLVAAVCIVIAKGASEPAFPITRAELQKDREWLQTLQTQKSND